MKTNLETSHALNGECDCCSQFRPLTQCWTSCGLETWACDACQGEIVEIDQPGESTL